MAGVGSALVTDKDIDSRSHRIYDFPFSLVAPLRSDQDIDLALQACRSFLRKIYLVEAVVVDILFFNSEIARCNWASFTRSLSNWPSTSTFGVKPT